MKPNSKTRIGFSAQLEPQPNEAPAVLLCEAENGGIFFGLLPKVRRFKAGRRRRADGKAAPYPRQHPSSRLKTR